MPRFPKGSNTAWYIEALCQGLGIGFSEVLIIIWYSRQETSAVTLGVMLTLPMAIGAITQALATKKTKIKQNPHRLASLSIAGQILGLSTMAFALTLGPLSNLFLFLGQCLYWMGGMTALSPTQDILAKSVPVEQHNRFFCRRAMVITVVTLLCNIITAFILDLGLTSGLLVQFIMIAAAARLISLMMINAHPAPNPNSGIVLISTDSPEVKEEAMISIVRLSLCMFLFRCAVNISSPFFSAYMLKEMNMSFSMYSVLTAVPLITKTFYLANWARLLDDNRKFEGLFLAIAAIGLTPILWSLNNNILTLAGLQVLSGVSWAGFDLISVLLIQHMYPRSVTNKLGLFLALGSLGSVLGGVIGGLLMNAGASYQNLFAISGGMRLVFGFVLLWYLRRNQLFRFHQLKLKHGLSTLITVRPSLEAAVRLVPFPSRRSAGRKKAA